MKTYSIIWKQFPKNSEIGKHLLVSEDFALPYFIDGDDKEKFENSKLSEFSELHLLCGVLIGYNENPPVAETRFLSKRQG